MQLLFDETNLLILNLIYIFFHYKKNLILFILISWWCPFSPVTRAYIRPNSRFRGQKCLQAAAALAPCLAVSPTLRFASLLMTTCHGRSLSLWYYFLWCLVCCTPKNQAFYMLCFSSSWKLIKRSHDHTTMIRDKHLSCELNEV